MKRFDCKRWAVGLMMAALLLLLALGACAETKTVTVGSFTLTGEAPLEEGAQYTYGANVLTILTDKTLTVKMALPGDTAVFDCIAVQESLHASLIFDGVRIDMGAMDLPALALKSHSTLNLRLTGDESVLQSGEGYAGITAPSGTELTISGDGALRATGGSLAAGIGGSDYQHDSGKITILSGTVTATGGNESAGIGSSADGDVGTITISGGTVAAQGGRNGAGIGSGSNNFHGVYSISIIISGGTVAATGGNYGAGIGGGRNAGGGNIEISGGTVAAQGGGTSAGIGNGSGASGGSVTIEGTAAVEWAIGGPKSSGIAADVINVSSGAKVTAVAGSGGQAMSRAPALGGYGTNDVWASANTDGTSDTAYSDGSIASYKFLAIPRAAATAATVQVKISDPETAYTSFSAAWAAASAETDTVSVRLYKDVTAAFNAPAGWPITVNRTSQNTLYLRLNGHTIDRGLTAPTDNGCVIAVYSNFHMAGNGRITGGNNAGDGGGVQIHGGGLEMDGGVVISGNKARRGGGIYIQDGIFFISDGVIGGNVATAAGGGVCLSDAPGVSANFIMYGGSVTGNAAPLGGGVYSAKDISFYLLRPAQIIGNTDTGASPKANNVYLAGVNNTISMRDALTVDAQIGVTTAATAAGAPVKNITCVSPRDWSAYFTSDDPAYLVQNSGTGENQVVRLVQRPNAAIILPSGSVVAGVPCTLQSSVTSGTGPYSYIWKANGAEYQTADMTHTFPSSGYFYVDLVVTDANGVSGHTAEIIAVVDVALSAAVTANPENIKPGDSTTLTAIPSGGVAPYTYDWTVLNGTASLGTAATLTQTPTQSTTYQVKVTDRSGAYTTETVRVNIVDPLSAAIAAAPGTRVIEGTAVTLTATPSGGLAPYTYNWTVKDGTTSLGTGETLTQTPAQTTTYQVTVKDAMNSTAVKTVEITVDPAERALRLDPAACDFGTAAQGYDAAALQKTITVQNVSNVPVTLNALPDSEHFVLTGGSDWADALPVNGTRSFTAVPRAGLAPGNYAENLTVSASGGASAALSVSFAVTALPVAATPVFSPAGGAYSGAQDVTISCATAGATIRYTTDGREPTAASPAYTGKITVSGDMTIKAKAFHSGMADSATASAAYTISAAPRILVQPVSQSVTEGERATFSVSATGVGLRYQWFIDRGAGWQALSGATGSSYTTSAVELSNDGFRYRCRITDVNGAALYTDTVTLHVGKAPVPPVTGDSATPGLWLALLLCGAGAVVWLLKRRRA